MTGPTPDHVTAYALLRQAVIMVRAGELPADMLDWAVTISDRAANPAAGTSNVDGGGTYDGYMAVTRPEPR